LNFYAAILFSAFSENNKAIIDDVRSLDLAVTVTKCLGFPWRSPSPPLQRTNKRKKGNDGNPIATLTGDAAAELGAEDPDDSEVSETEAQL
jgi:hypothetical protein